MLLNLYLCLNSSTLSNKEMIGYIEIRRNTYYAFCVWVFFLQFDDLKKLSNVKATKAESNVIQLNSCRKLISEKIIICTWYTSNVVYRNTTFSNACILLYKLTLISELRNKAVKII